ncbi:MAG: 2,3,4,5-tetrahydropyridine-2,6-dicarboxylate N-succinyltransferase [Blastocatellia bacterium]|nr:2,3,4,5-tetrahydropyridine-2,6-dicarboxylate N-succinyltransferase [Blastocatellia bacterium]MCS7157980.1 2,3,4,5-tetrahydropyridine-2,6-dicarboxylate N-succinyltransferase [Blastocatellia bacterium]MCX7752487.1 2,3,4,5-tetrahydropyridine-2,6-dicarboxylate N-succinyltransferase [Blastocatellia bacterium]MDW8167398.1 2,3,4,5-tetrahydropyridine-2,6-dicarboxylate N-succinyltransferase [Acidobacteriota bacterium]MDW8257424.1 2,3,4,5-tetrahydropyridine-2,6-dicarboxylate N-succinyltransferase [Aci
MELSQLKAEIERLFDAPLEEARERGRPVFEEFKRRLNEGQIRAAEPSAGRWIVNAWVKKGILLGFRIGALTDYSINEQFRFSDKDTYPLKGLDGVRHGVRIVPGGTAIRDGAYVASGVVIMPPSYINVGAYVDEGTMVDSHVLIGSCAQIGKRVHVSAGAQIGGVLEPPGAWPVVIEDDVLVGSQCGVFEGTIVKRRAVLGAGVILTGSTPVYDLVHERIYRGTPEEPLVIPEGAVVVPGARLVPGDFARAHGLAVATPVIVKYRDERTDWRTALEEILRMS